MKRPVRVSVFVILLCLLVTGGVFLMSSKPDEVFQKKVGTLQGVTMQVKEGTVSSTKAVVYLTNETERTYSYGAEFQLQKLVDGEWYSMTYITNSFGFPALESILKPGQIEIEFDWAIPYGVMKPGTYRVVKTVYKSDMSPCYLAAEFLI